LEVSYFCYLLFRPHKQKIQKKKREIQKYKKVLEEKQKKDKYISLEEHTRTPRKLPKIG
jgi:flagellar motor component MotA